MQMNLVLPITFSFYVLSIIIYILKHIEMDNTCKYIKFNPENQIQNNIP